MLPRTHVVADDSCVRKVHLLPNLLTLANAFCGLLAICKAIDALALGSSEHSFHTKMETAAWLIFLGMVFDAVDGKVARMVGGASAFGAQLDSFSDMLTFGVAPAVIAKVLLEHEGFPTNPRVNFVAAAVFATMAILRLARFNLETEPDESAHRHFKGLPSPAAAGTVASSILMYLSLKHPDLEFSDGTRTPLGALLRLFPQIDQSPFLGWMLGLIGISLPICGLLMVSRVRYVHMFSALTGRGQFVTLVSVVVALILLFVAPVLSVFFLFHVYVITGVVRWALARRRRTPPGAPPASASSA
jgi:CDP-diacylglycerol---serine O-phosphatidyltransferase